MMSMIGLATSASGTGDEDGAGPSLLLLPGVRGARLRLPALLGVEATPLAITLASATPSPV